MNNVAEIVYATSTLIIATSLLIAVLRGYKKLQAKVGNVELVAEAVNAAVNNIEPGEPTLRSVVVGINRKLDDHISESSRRLDKIEDHLTNPESKVNKTVDKLAEHVDTRKESDS